MDPSRSLNVGVAAHISAASPGGARYDPQLSAQERTSARNGIWLCQTCAKLIDNDVAAYDFATLRGWKAAAEESGLRVCRQGSPGQLALVNVGVPGGSGIVHRVR
jgi:hypothetical protein